MCTDALLDLRSCPASHRRGAALAAAQALAPGQTMRMTSDESPELLLQSLNIHLRDALRWHLETDGSGLFLARVTLTGDSEPLDVIDLLTRHHKTLDLLLARALHLVNGGDASGAAPLVHDFCTALRRHFAVENELLAPAFAAPVAAAGDDPTSTMLREHDELEKLVGLIEFYFEDGIPDPRDVAPYFAILSGTLAKHEYREENNLFPGWQVALERAPAPARDALFGTIRDILGGGGGDQGPPPQAVIETR